MKPRTEIIDHRVVNSVEQLASFLQPGDLFRKINSKTQYIFDELRIHDKEVLCKNLDTNAQELIFYRTPVLKLVIY
jgi:hypothetical protein